MNEAAFIQFLLTVHESMHKTANGELGYQSWILRDLAGSEFGCLGRLFNVSHLPCIHRQVHVPHFELLMQDKS